MYVYRKKENIDFSPKTANKKNITIASELPGKLTWQWKNNFMNEDVSSVKNGDVPASHVVSGGGVWMAEMWIGKGLLRLLLQANHIEEIERPYLYNGMWSNNHSNKYIISINVSIFYIYYVYYIYICYQNIPRDQPPPHQFFFGFFLWTSASVPGFVAVLHPPPLTPWQAIPRSGRWWR